MIAERQIRTRLRTVEAKLAAITAQRAAIDREWAALQEERRSVLTEINHLEHNEAWSDRSQGHQRERG